MINSFDGHEIFSNSSIDAPIKVYGQAQVDINIALGHFNKVNFPAVAEHITVPVTGARLNLKS